MALLHLATLLVLQSGLGLNLQEDVPKQKNLIRVKADGSAKRAVNEMNGANMGAVESTHTYAIAADGHAAQPQTGKTPQRVKETVPATGSLVEAAVHTSGKQMGSKMILKQMLESVSPAEAEADQPPEAAEAEEEQKEENELKAALGDAATTSDGSSNPDGAPADGASASDGASSSSDGASAKEEAEAAACRDKLLERCKVIKVRIGDKPMQVKRWDKWDEPIKEPYSGYVTSVDPLKVTSLDDPTADGYSWDHVCCTKAQNAQSEQDATKADKEEKLGATAEQGAGATAEQNTTITDKDQVKDQDEDKKQAKDKLREKEDARKKAEEEEKEAKKAIEAFAFRGACPGMACLIVLVAMMS